MIIRLFAVLFFVMSLMVAGAGAALAFDPPDDSPQNVCWNPPDFPGVGTRTPDGNGAAWNAHRHSGQITNVDCNGPLG